MEALTLLVGVVSGQSRIMAGLAGLAGLLGWPGCWASGA